jgi:hypothetical protein
MRKIILILLGITLSRILISCDKEEEFRYPLVFTGNVINITDTSALFTARISNFGNYPILESGFIWGVHSKDNNGIKIKNNESTNDIYYLETNEKLLPGKTFYVRAYVQTEITTSYGKEVSFESPKGQIDITKWSQIYNAHFIYLNCEYVRSSFTINDMAYFIFQRSFNNGELYSYNAKTNSFQYELSSNILITASFSAVYQGKAYVFSKNAFYLFNPQLKTFTKLSVLDENDTRHGLSGFLIKDDIYIGLGSISGQGYNKDFWRYNIPTDSWHEVASFPGEKRYNGFSFSINNFGYVGGGKFNDLWCYIPESNNWIPKKSHPYQNAFYYGTNTENFGYSFSNNKFHEYNPIFDNWEEIADLDFSFNSCNPHLFAIDNKVFCLVINHIDEKRFKMWVYEK